MTGFSAVPVPDEFEDDHDRRWAGVARVVGPDWARLPSLTIGLFGVQMLWSVEMSYGQVPPVRFETTLLMSRYSLTVPALTRPVKIVHGHRLPRRSTLRSHRAAHDRHVSARSFVVQALTTSLSGILADNSKSRFGRRRPFIMVCAALCAFATLLLGFTRPFATIFTTLASPSVSYPFPYNELHSPAAE